MRIIHFPLESYKERYTKQLSGKDGWLESRWKEHGLDVLRIKGNSIDTTHTIKHGQVLDACGRGYFACSQIMNFLHLLYTDEITSDDILFFDDFWTPGIEALPYAFHLTGVKPKMYSLLHAQSVDEYDFTHYMRNWIRPFEKGIASIMSGIFVTSTILKELVVNFLEVDEEKVHITGLPYNSTLVKKELRKNYPSGSWGITDSVFVKKRQVVFSSRFDKEKDPEFFLYIVKKMANIDPSIKFVITTSQKYLRSNDKDLMKSLSNCYDKLPNLEIRENQTKQQYYETLKESKIQFNCAWQDFVSWTLLEALTFKCIPVYPDFRSFPEVLPDKYLYPKISDLFRSSEDTAIDIITTLMEEDFDPKLNKIVETFDKSWLRMVNVMIPPEKEIDYPLFK